MRSCFNLFSRGLNTHGERLSLAGCALLAVVYAATLLWMDLTADPVDARYFAQRDSLRLALLPDFTLPVGLWVRAVQDGALVPQVALLRGWSPAEPWGVWSDGEAAELAVALPGTGPMPAAIGFAVNMFPNASSRQRITLMAGGRTLAVWDPPFASELRARLPADMAQPGTVLRLTFAIAKPRNPPGDSRRIALGLREVALLP